MSLRTVKRVVTGKVQYDGAGVKLVRVISRGDVVDFDPFLMLDAFDADNPQDYIQGFPWHPHRGIETVTYLVQGHIEHGDSLGNKGKIEDGQGQWMTAGSGILHQEMPQAADRLFGLQLWVNLPQKHKMATPKYRDINEGMIPIVQDDDSVVRVVSGKYGGREGAVQGEYVKTLLLDVAVQPDRIWELKLPAEDTLFVYIFKGTGAFGDRVDNYGSHQAVLFGDGNQFSVTASSEGMRFMLFSATPLKEPVAWGGPIVMNTDEELRSAFEELENGTFVREDIRQGL